jgi:hypothetical protein
MSWTCDSCGSESFGEVVFENGCVHSIDSVDLDPETLARLHYISLDLQDRLEAIVGGSLYTQTGIRSDWLPALQRALAEGKRW